MRYEFTPAAQRAVAFAARLGRDQRIEVEAPALLLGLLAESECRAALMLSRCGVMIEAVREQWPELLGAIPPDGVISQRQVRLSSEIESSLSAVCERLSECPRPLVVATEHLLLALVATDHEAGRWLRAHGLEAAAIEAEIHRVYGHQARDEGRVVSGGACPAGVLRILDAAGNRAREALRTIEDFVRFVLDDAHLTGLCKQLRHDLAAALNAVPTLHLLAARETQADVGTRLSTAGEETRDGTAAVLTANFARLQESLRSLEEFGKLVGSKVGADLKSLRYRSYTLQRAVEIARSSLERLADARLYVLIDGRSSPAEFEQFARGLIEAGVHMLQLRDKRLDDRQLLERVRLLRQLTVERGACVAFRSAKAATFAERKATNIDPPNLTQGTGTLLIVNDRPDLALACHADGVHLGQDDLSVKDARAILGPEALIGVSTHSIDQARQAVLDGASYLGVGPVFPSGTKHFEHFPGLELLRSVAAEVRLPAFAIGGITFENLPEVLSTGVSRVAVSGAVATATDPAAAARNLIQALV